VGAVGGGAAPPGSKLALLRRPARTDERFRTHPWSRPFRTADTDYFSAIQRLTVPVPEVISSWTNGTQEMD
jgi:hypothetical protein